MTLPGEKVAKVLTSSWIREIERCVHRESLQFGGLAKPTAYQIGSKLAAVNDLRAKADLPAKKLALVRLGARCA